MSNKIVFVYIRWFMGSIMEKFYVYVVLTRTNTVISRLIQLFKKDEFTHAAISLDRDLATCIVSEENILSIRLSVYSSMKI